MKTTAILMLKAPRPGTVKTRLASEIGVIRATAVYRTLAAHQIAQIPASWDCAVHFAPSDAGEEMQKWIGSLVPPGTRFEPQVSGNLGDRMLAAAANELDRGADAVFLLGGDCPDLLTQALLDAAGFLHRADIVIGPAADGGYVFLATRLAHPGLFDGIPWSTPDVLAQTIARAGSLGLKVELTKTYADVDDASSLADASLRCSPALQKALS